MFIKNNVFEIFLIPDVFNVTASIIRSFNRRSVKCSKQPRAYEVATNMLDATHHDPGAI